MTTHYTKTAHMPGKEVMLIEDGFSEALGVPLYYGERAVIEKILSPGTTMKPTTQVQVQVTLRLSKLGAERLKAIKQASGIERLSIFSAR